LNVSYHLGGGVNYFHLLEDGGSIVGDEDSALRVLDLKLRLEFDSVDGAEISGLIRVGRGAKTYHFIHTAGAKRGTHNIGHSYKYLLE
jgi:hypothetical protein